MNFMTIDDLKKQSEPVQSKEERKTTDSYVGGKSSGIAVENPDEICQNRCMMKKNRKLLASSAKNAYLCST